MPLNIWWSYATEPWFRWGNAWGTKNMLNKKYWNNYHNEAATKSENYLKFSPPQLLLDKILSMFFIETYLLVALFGVESTSQAALFWI